MDGDKAGIAGGAKLLDTLASKSLAGGRLDTWSKMQDTKGSEYMANACMQGTRWQPQLKHCIAVPQGAGGTQAKQGAAGVRGVGGVGDEIVASRFE